MEVTEEQRRRAEANRLVALEKRKRATASSAAAAGDAWRLVTCPGAPASRPPPPPPKTFGFRVALEVCSADEFSVAVEPAEGVAFPGEAECLRAVEGCLASVVQHSMMESQSGHLFSVSKLTDYELVLKCLKKLPGVIVQEIPYSTRKVLQTFSSCNDHHWVPSLDHHYSDEQVDELLANLPRLLRDALLPFQLEGVRFGLRRGGRCLIADEMGLGKTLQAITIACCFKDEGPILIVCPAVLRYTWAEELEHWDPSFLPKDIHLVFGHQNSLDYLDASPRVVVISYKMLSRLRNSMVKRRWALMIVDESHNIRCTKKKSEKNETNAILELATNVKRIVLLSGTPSLSRPYDIYHQVNMLWPGLLGKDKYEFAKKYCLMSVAKGCQGKIYQDFSKGTRLMELNVLLRQALMIRRLKEHVLQELPPKRRQIIRLKLKASDIRVAASSCRVTKGISMSRYNSDETLNVCSSDQTIAHGNEQTKDHNICDDDIGKKSPRQLSSQEIGIAKVSGFGEWFSNQSVMKGSDADDDLDFRSGCQKMVVFAHHLKVLDGIQAIVAQNGIKFVRIDGSTLPRERKEAVEAFRSCAEVRVAIIGITAGGVGLDFSSAQNVVFVELPKSASEMLQAEDRAHRRGQTNAVNIYIFCAKDTLDESHWLHLNQSLFRVSSLMNGKQDAIREIEVDRVFHLEQSRNAEEQTQHEVVLLENESEAANERSKEITEDNEISIQAWTGIKDMEVDSDFIIRTVPLQFQDKGHDVDIQSHPIVREDIDCDVYCSSCAAPVCTLSSSCKSLKAGRRHSGNSGTSDLAATDSNYQIQVDFLRFEVSQHTGRIHLYICIPGTDSRPRPLIENFRPEEVESSLFSSGDVKEVNSQLLKENPVFCNVFKTFIKEWSALRPIDQMKLLGKPLQLPLSLELCYLKDSVNHSSQGLLKGGSKRRITPLSDVSNPLPENADWKRVVLHNGTAKQREYSQGWTVNDEPLCKLCQGLCNGKLSKSPEYFEDLFCSLACFGEYRIRTSRRALRQALFQIERGICSKCKLDCCKLVKCIKPLSTGKRKEYIRNFAPKLASRKKLLDKLVHEPTEGNAWHADHIVPVYKGGGECRLENMRTLCVACHYEATKAQRDERKLLRIKAKEQLKLAMKQQKDESREVWEEIDDESLLVNVPGSSYSIKDDVSDARPE